MRKYLALLLVLVIVSAFAASAFAQLTLTLSVNVNPGALLNVTYTAKIDPVVSTQPQLVKFYTDKDPGNLFPPVYVGSAYTNIYGVATFSFKQTPGKYLGGAILVPSSTTSNVVHYVVY